MKLFKENLIKKKELSRIQGGSSEGHSVNTSQCTWRYTRTSGQTVGDSSPDGSWYSSC